MTVLSHEDVRAYWGANQVADIPADVTAEESLLLVEQRFRMYPGLEDLMPVDTCEGKDVLDFGCGPGHDTVGFLHSGAAHVYAADVSWKGLSATRGRLEAHGWLDNATLMLVGDGYWRAPKVDHVHTAGVLHHVADPVHALKRLGAALVGPRAEIRAMVYSADSWFYKVKCGGDPENFRLHADAGSPISHAWTEEQVRRLAFDASLDARLVGSYCDPCEPEGPGLMACYSIRWP